MSTSDLFASAQASVRFALSCLHPFHGHLRPNSSFANPQAEVMHWHNFGDLIGPGWAANALGGAHLLYRWGRHTGDAAVQSQALALLDHVLEDDYLRADGFIWPYFDLGKQQFCLNYRHGMDWLCPGSLAKIGVQLLDFAADLPGDPRADRMQQAALSLGRWFQTHTSLLPNGWAPRRINPDGSAYPLNPYGDSDIIFDHSADGLYLLQLYALLTAGGLGDFAAEASLMGHAFVSAGGFWGSLNHDTYDDHECVAYAVAFRVLRQAGRLLNQPAWSTFTYQAALPELNRFRMSDDRNGVPTRGLLWMEESWDTAYLWENAEAAQAYLEAWQDTGNEAYWMYGVDILTAISRHHHGALGFLTEGVDWNNHVGQQHHVDQALYGDINYTEPLLNNLHFVDATMNYFSCASSHSHNAGSA